ncbi:MAG: calcium/sodium antiporter [Gammaproteobacteria bacterium]|nr:calcium/sodium antiporter [Gammaproteobacteria bacterium]MDH4254626.1 calcium/sodium antiporter [Gammaproteobacteria bacterium]MDH5309454.1 calcium/sodium antiporter [Gammaproteobacteria bacterium]
MIDLLLTIAGIVLLLAGGTGLVRGASQIAMRFGVSEMVVGLTIVAFGTSTPELVVNVISGLRGASEVAFGNVIGSNITNLGLVLGAAALMMPVQLHGQVVKRELPFLLLGTTVIAVMALDGTLKGDPPQLDRSDSLILLLLFLIFIYLMASDIWRSRRDDPLVLTMEARVHEHQRFGAMLPWLLAFGGVGLLFIGGEMTVRGAIDLSTAVGIPAEIVGLFVVAVGTSLPELVTSVIAARRGESDLALGNVVGSNIFNGLFVLPAGGLITDIVVPHGGVADIAVSWLFAALLIPIFYLGRSRFGRGFGVLFLLGYFTYVIVRTSTGGH